MKGFKEWISDNLRYLVLILALAMAIFAIILGLRLYNAISQEDHQQTPATEAASERGDTIVILNSETEPVTEKTTEAVTEAKTEKVTESETASEKESETEKSAVKMTERGTEKKTQPQRQSETTAAQSETTKQPDIVIEDPEAEQKENVTVQPTTTRQTEEIDTLENMQTTTKYAATELNIRSGPGTNYRIIAGAEAGEGVTVTGQTNEWYQVKTDNGTGYIYKGLLENEPVYIEPTYATINSGCYIRSEADYGDNIIGELYGGEQVEVIGSPDGWAKISVNGITGYVGAKFLS